MATHSYPPLDSASRSALYASMGTHFQGFNSLLEKNIVIIKALQKRCNKTKEEKFALALYELSAFVATVNLDIATFLRADFRSEHSNEKRINIRYVNVAVIEGYKYLGGAHNENPKHAKWNQFKMIAHELCDSQLNNDIANFDILLEEFKKTSVNKVNTYNRNLAIHYDQDPFKVYDYYMNLSEDIEIKHVNKFLKLIDALAYFLHTYIMKTKIERKPDEVTFMPADYRLFEQLNTLITQNHALFSVAGNFIETRSKDLDKIASYRQLPEYLFMQQDKKFQFAKKALAEKIKPILDIMKPGFLTLLIYLDLCTAIRAFLSSESYHEKQLNLRHIEVIVYEASRHLYGFNEKQRRKSIWQTLLLPFLRSATDPTLILLLVEIKEGLEKITSNENINNELLRECFVHYRYEKRDNIVTLFEESEKSIAVFEFHKARLLLEFLPKILKTNEAILSQKGDILKEQDLRKQQELIKNLRMPLSKITNPRQKAAFEKMLAPLLSSINKFFS